VTDFETLDPALARDTPSISAIQMIFTGLVQYNNKLEIVPQLAQSWQQEADGVTWTFHLKPNLTFNDGSPLTSSDVAYSIDRALQPTTQSTTAPLYLSLIKDADQLLAGRIPTLLGRSLQTPDPTTLVVSPPRPIGSGSSITVSLRWRLRVPVSPHGLDRLAIVAGDQVALCAVDGPKGLYDLRHSDLKSGSGDPLAQVPGPGGDPIQSTEALPVEGVSELPDAVRRQGKFPQRVRKLLI